MKRLILALTLLAAAGAGTRAQTAAGGDAAAEEMRRDIKRLLVLSRGAEVGLQIIRQSMDELRKALSFLPEAQREKVIKVFEEEMLKEFTPESMVELVVPIYEKHLTGEDVKALIDFYQTPLGQRMLDVLPVITREAYEAGAARGKAAGDRAMQRVMREGVLTPPTMQLDPSVVIKPTPPAKRSTTRRKRN